MSVTTHKTPGVYIQELDAFGNSVVPVPTAVPVFIGYTENTSYNGESLIQKVVKVTSLAEFYNIFGVTAPTIQFELSAPFDSTAIGAKVPDFVYPDPTSAYTVDPPTNVYRLFSAMKFFYANGGADCYVMSIGNYTDQNNFSSTDPFTNAITSLQKEPEPTILVIPDAVSFADPQSAFDIQNAMIDHCGEMKNRVAILDIPGGFDETTDSVGTFRNKVSGTLPKSNSYAAAYYPWLHTTIYQESDVSYKNLSDAANTLLETALRTEFGVTTVTARKDDMDPKDIQEYNKAKEIDVMISYLTGKDYKGTDYDDNPMKYSELNADKQNKVREAADAAIKNLSIFYPLVMDHIQKTLNLLPPSAAMAGIYTAVDNSIGVWKAPANVAMQDVIAPAVKIDDDMQNDLNVPISGKSVCAIRAFPGRGILVWGARTLDGNSNDWRYINVRRTLIFLEQSVKDAAKAYVFAANDASTWVNVQSMISNFLTGVWKQGGLAGPKASDTFSVSVGLGSTMTNYDVQQGIMRVSVLVAVSHPAEFIEITFQQEMQKA